MGNDICGRDDIQRSWRSRIEDQQRLIAQVVLDNDLEDAGERPLSFSVI
jgi:hypothetical protein